MLLVWCALEQDCSAVARAVLNTLVSYPWKLQVPLYAHGINDVRITIVHIVPLLPGHVCPAFTLNRYFYPTTSPISKTNACPVSSS